MSKDIPKDIIDQYETVISKLKRENITQEEWKSKILNTKEDVMEMNKWYIVDITEGGGDRRSGAVGGRKENLELLYPTTWGTSYDSGGQSRPVNPKLGGRFWVKGYFAHISLSPWFISYLYREGSDYMVLLGLKHTINYRIDNCEYLPLEINYDGTFMNWLDENPLEVKE